MFSSIAPSPSQSSRRTATLCSIALHAAATGALWTASQAIVAPPMARHEAREAVLVVSPPPRLYRPRTLPKMPVQRFEVLRAALTRAPEAVRPEPQAPVFEARPDRDPILPLEQAIELENPAAKAAGFPEFARTTPPRSEREPRPTAFGDVPGRPEPSGVAPAGGPAVFGAVGPAQAKSSFETAGDGRFGGVEIGPAVRPTAMAQETGFGTAERGPAARTAGEPASERSRSQPVKILWKPTPKYSEEGLRRRIEGDVVLRVRFLARGTVETLDIIQGLGYGLDEYALQAAQAIRFEPAVEGDRAIDSTAQVRIRFELAY